MTDHNESLPIHYDDSYVGNGVSEDVLKISLRLDPTSVTAVNANGRLSIHCVCAYGVSKDVLKILLASILLR